MRTTHRAVVVRVHERRALLADSRSAAGEWFSMPLSLLAGVQVGDAVIVTVDRRPRGDGARPRVVSARRAAMA